MTRSLPLPVLYLSTHEKEGYLTESDCLAISPTEKLWDTVEWLDPVDYRSRFCTHFAMMGNGINETQQYRNECILDILGQNMIKKRASNDGPPWRPGLKAAD